MFTYAFGRAVNVYDLIVT